MVQRNFSFLFLLNKRREGISFLSLIILVSQRRKWMSASLTISLRLALTFSFFGLTVRIIERKGVPRQASSWSSVSLGGKLLMSHEVTANRWISNELAVSRGTRILLGDHNVSFLLLIRERSSSNIRKEIVDRCRILLTVRNLPSLDLAFNLQHNHDHDLNRLRSCAVG